MSIVNRRNAILGWLAWLGTKTYLKQKARAAVPGTAEGSRRPNTGAIVSVLAAIGGAIWFWRRSGGAAAEE